MAVFNRALFPQFWVPTICIKPGWALWRVAILVPLMLIWKVSMNSHRKTPAVFTVCNFHSSKAFCITSSIIWFTACLMKRNVSPAQNNHNWTPKLIFSSCFTCKNPINSKERHLDTDYNQGLSKFASLKHILQKENQTTAIDSII